MEINIDKLKAEINTRKSEKTTKNVALGNLHDGGIPKLGKKQFLSELVTSMHTGAKTNAVETIRAVNETVEMKKGIPNAAVNKSGGKFIPPRNMKQQDYQEVAPVNNFNKTPVNDWGIPSGVKGLGGDGERDDLFERENAKFDQMKMSGSPIATKLIKETKQPRYITEQNEDLNLNEENIEKIVENAFKNVLTKLYTKEKMKEMLDEYHESDEFVNIVAKAIKNIVKTKKMNTKM